MSHRIELLFSGKAPASELERARIMASANVTEAIQDLSKALEAAGLPHAVDCRTVRESMGRPRKVASEGMAMPRPTMVPDAAE